MTVDNRAVAEQETDRQTVIPTALTKTRIKRNKLYLCVGP